MVVFDEDMKCIINYTNTKGFRPHRGRGQVVMEKKQK